MITVTKYGFQTKAAWDQFITHSKNGVFLFHRDYMEYHADRFTDHSLLFFDDDELLALLPANIQDSTLVSHGGLTFGGIISDGRMRAATMLEIFDSLITYLKEQNIKRLIYKAIPHIYHSIPAEEDLYALFRCGAQLYRRDVSSTIDRHAPTKFSERRRRGIARAKKNGLVVKPSDDFKTFFDIEEHVLTTRHGVKPVHTAAEMSMLAKRFPSNIELYAAFRHEQMLGGVIMYVSPNVAHAQYISATDEGKELGALDLVLDYLINERYTDKRYFDFGISTEREGQYLNVGLDENKEGFGARTTVYDFYQLDL